MKELLTPRERFGLLVIDEPQDRVPVFPLVTAHAARVAGISVRDYYTDGTAMARSQLVAQETYGIDFVSFFSEVGLVAEALGSQFDYPEDDLPLLARPKWTGLAEPDDRVADPRVDGRLRVYVEAISYAYEARGDTVPILAYVPAPFTTAQQLVDQEAFLLGLLTEPEGVKELLAYATRSITRFCRAIIGAGGLPILVDPLASGSVISADHYREFALPSEAEVVRCLHRYDLDVVLHICGETQATIGMMPETGADLLSIDRIALPDAVAGAGQRCRIIGNYDTSAILLSDPVTVEHDVAEMVTAGRSCPRGFVAATGCEVPLDTPPENVRAFVRAAKEAGFNPDYGRRRR
ncbi:uroporphyrinogen decarboxylase family protein [candidate division WOR-3 bacterium]|nr:uroporphyrinogen decarboxylase family protein [candidate division WOR-3 bacterium]